MLKICTKVAYLTVKKRLPNLGSRLNIVMLLLNFYSLNLFSTDFTIDKAH